ncbi:GNAT family N-acetyltransferase [Bizionia arctica]|uniref:N-acetyltransferase n=1 Tax=Bizionia arctica TaxID=1495645 RepID=A0A917GEK8_9FLAO|nr:GNAT family N-acetyltransferase [Bizionia arctica]GGG41357.1 N-acetyltransferase [Bizionia arctica]
MYQVTQVSHTETYRVRQPILREGKPIETCVFEGDTDKDTFHLGLFSKKQLIGVASFMKNKSLLFSEEKQYQLRGMAILKEFQHQGLGAQLIEAGECILNQEEVNVLWFNAREIAVKFYKNHGFKIIGDTFNIPNIGIHHVMFKKLN